MELYACSQEPCGDDENRQLRVGVPSSSFQELCNTELYGCSQELCGDGEYSELRVG